MREFDCPQYYCNIPDYDCHSDSEDSSEHLDEEQCESLYGTVDGVESSIEYDDDGIDVHAIPGARPEQTRYDDLDRELGHDETLSNRVLQMHSLLAEHYDALHYGMDTLKVDLEHGAADETTKLAWHSWFAIV